MTTLWDTTGTAVVKALAAERRTGGAVLSGLALTLVVVVDEKDVAEAETAATTAASRHPCRLLIVVRRQVDAPVPRLDAEVLIGGRLGPGEAIVMRMHGRLALHAESVTLPLLAPDTPVVTWWYGEPPDLIAHDPLGVFAERRVTDILRSADPVAALHQRANDFAAGDTDLCWTRATAWRALLASTFDTVRATPTSAVVYARQSDPVALLLAGWLCARLGLRVPVDGSRVPPARAGGSSGGAGAASSGIGGVRIDLDDGATLDIDRSDGRHVVLRRTGQPESNVAVPDRDLGDLLAEELRRLDADQPYANALSAATGVPGLADRPSKRVHIWRDPAEASAGEARPGEQTGAGPVPATAVPAGTGPGAPAVDPPGKQAREDGSRGAR